jgi:glycyl-tRNA synthetase beta chain
VPDEFQDLPQEVIATVLVHHQKYIPLGVPGANVPGFAAVTNTDGSEKEIDEIRRGMERVVVARLRDASFFYAEDSKRPLTDRVGDLAGVTFHQGLGTYLDKADRMVRLVEAMGREEGLLSDAQRKAASQAARLAKADLTTLMVREFPELQGTMGGIYLRTQGASPDVVAAVRWHYHPIALGKLDSPDLELVEEGADTRVFAVVSLADKLDTLAGYFGLGLNPTGSSDPFGLRRAAQGVVRVLLDFWRPNVGEPRPSLSALARKAIEGYGPLLKSDPEKLAWAVEWFFLERIAFVFTSRGYPADEVRAVIYADDDEPGPAFAEGAGKILVLKDVKDAYERLEALNRVRAENPEDFANLAMAFKRAKNILEKRLPASVDPSRLKEPAEFELYQAVSSLAGANGTYEARLRALASLRVPVDRFFEGVRVMVDESELQENRLALLNQTLSLFYRIADISKLGGQS